MYAWHIEMPVWRAGPDGAAFGRCWDKSPSGSGNWKLLIWAWEAAERAAETGVLTGCFCASQIVVLALLWEFHASSWRYGSSACAGCADLCGAMPRSASYADRVVFSVVVVGRTMLSNRIRAFLSYLTSPFELCPQILCIRAVQRVSINVL